MVVKEGRKSPPPLSLSLPDAAIFCGFLTAFPFQKQTKNKKPSKKEKEKKMTTLRYSSSSFESEDESNSVSSASPMSVSSSEASSPYAIDDLDNSSDAVHERLNASSPSSPATPSPAHRADDDDNSPWSCYRPYRPFNGAKSVRWFRDDRGLFSEHSRRSTPYQRRNSNSRGTKEVSEALIEAVRRQDLSEIGDLIGRHEGNNINILGREGDSPLHRSCRLGCLETVKLLVRHGADPELTNREGWSPLHLAVDSGYQDVVVYLLSLSRR